MACYYIPDPSFVIAFRETYTNEIWWFSYAHKAHVVGVDSIFVLSYLHIFKKIYLRNFSGVDVDGWVTGAYAFVFYHVVVFLGITLSSNHLSDLTLTIGANIYWSLAGFKHKAYAPVFTNRHLNADQLTRFMLAHYVAAWYYVYLVHVHTMFIHEMWDADSGRSAAQSAASPKGSWSLDAAQREALAMGALYACSMGLVVAAGHPDARAVNFSFFEQWSEAEAEDINFFIVGPHWYFRPHMGLLTLCATHYEGLCWLAAFYVSLALLPLWARSAQPSSSHGVRAPDLTHTRGSSLQGLLFALFVISVLYIGSVLPCARFFYDGGDGYFGSSLLRAAYEYVYMYLFVLVHVVDRAERFLEVAEF